MKIFLDDIRLSPEKYDLTFKHAEDLIDWIKENPTTQVDLLSLDHDLDEGSEETGIPYMTGYDFVLKHLPYLPNNIKKIQLHTSNSVGRINMFDSLHSSKQHGLLPNLEVIHDVVIDVVDGIESEAPWFKMKPKH